MHSFIPAHTYIGLLTSVKGVTNMWRMAVRALVWNLGAENPTELGYGKFNSCIG